MGKPTTETLDRLYLEWSQFTKAKTQRELHLEALLKRAVEWIEATRRNAEAEGTTVDSLEPGDIPLCNAIRAALAAQSQTGDDHA